MALVRAVRRIGNQGGRNGAILALVAGIIAVVNGGLNLAVATGGPGSGNGVVGGAAAFVTWTDRHGPGRARSDPLATHRFRAWANDVSSASATSNPADEL